MELSQGRHHDPREGVGHWIEKEEGGDTIDTTEENHIITQTPTLNLVTSKPLILTEEHTAEDRRMEEGVRNVGEITKCNIKKENQKLESKSSQKSSSTHKIPETHAKKQEEGVRKALPSTKVRKRIQSLEKKLVRKTGDGEKRKLEEKLEEDEQSRGKGDREGGKEDKYMGEKPGGEGRELAKSKLLISDIKSWSSEIKHEKVRTFTYTDNKLLTLSGTMDVKTLVSRFENYDTKIKDNFDFAKHAVPKLDSICALLGSPSKKLKLSESLEAATPSTPPPSSSLRRRLPRSSWPWWRPRGSPTSSSSPSARPRTPLPIRVAENCPPNHLDSRGTVRLGRQDIRRSGTLSRPGRSSSSPPEDEQIPCTSTTSAMLPGELATNASQQPAIQAHHHHLLVRDLPAGIQQDSVPLGSLEWQRTLDTGPSSSSEPAATASSPRSPPPSPTTRRKFTTLSRRKQPSSSSPGKKPRSSLENASLAPVSTYLQRPEYPALPGTKVHLTRCAPSTKRSSSTPTGLSNQPGKKSIFTFKGAIREGEEDPPIVPKSIINSTFHARGISNCTLAGTSSVRWGGKTTNQVERKCASQSEQREPSGITFGMITMMTSSPRGQDHPPKQALGSKDSFH